MVSCSMAIVNLILFTISGLAGLADAFWRLPCNGRAGVARIDPLAQFGRVANHAHVIHGGNNFGFSSGYNDVMKSECTSCGVKQDRSVYWTPALYFESSDGQISLVNQVGGMLVYYLLFGESIQAFPPEFQMIAGDSYRRNFTLTVPDPPKSDWTQEERSETALRQKAIGFNCLDYGKQPEPTLFRHFLPDKAYIDQNCPDGVRFEIMFPSCWNGEVDSTDHMSHVAYPDEVITGKCPQGYDQRLVSMLYETIYDTHSFKGKDGRFVLSNGDPTGYGYHGDFLTGWEPEFLQQAIDTCTNPSGKVEDCALFDLQSQTDQNKCNISPLPTECADEDIKGPRHGLPGDVKILSGPQYAKQPVGVSSISSIVEPTTSVTPFAPSTDTVVPTLSYTSASDSNTVVTAANVIQPSEPLTPDTDTIAPASTSTESSSLSMESTKGLMESRTIPTALSSDSTVTPASASMTSYVTDGTMVQVYIVQETVTVTEDVAVTTEIRTTAGYRKRAGGMHGGHRHVHNREGR